MKKRLLQLLLSLGFCPVFLPAQIKVGPPETPPAAAVPTDARPIPETPDAAAPIQTVTMTLKWNDAGGGFRIPVRNFSERVLRIDAIQSSGDLFIGSFPSVVPPKGSAEIIAFLDAKPGTNNESDIIRLKTSQGEQTLIVEHIREKVVSFDRQEIKWEVGEAAIAKSVVLQIANGATTLSKARALAGATATVDDLGGGKFRINVTPRSTATPTSFPVILEFSPALPGASPMITCSIGSKG